MSEWVWSTGRMTLTGKEWSSWRKTCLSAILVHHHASVVRGQHNFVKVSCLKCQPSTIILKLLPRVQAAHSLLVCFQLFTVWHKISKYHLISLTRFTPFMNTQPQRRRGGGGGCYKKMYTTTHNITLSFVTAEWQYPDKKTLYFTNLYKCLGTYKNSNV